MESVPIDIQYYTMIICSCLSILGSSFIIISSTFTSNSKAFYTKIVLFISFSDLIRSILFLIPCNNLNDIILINLFGILNDSSILITISWSTYISVILYLVVVKSKVNFDQHFKYWFIFSFIIIPALNTLPIITNSHGCQGTVCTMKSGTNGDIWRYSLIYFPSWVLITLSTACCIIIYIEIQKISLDEIQEYLVKKLIFYPIILILEFLPMTICTLLISTQVLSNSSIISVTSTNIFALHGISNCIIFAINFEKHRADKMSIHKSLPTITAKIDTSDFGAENLLFNTFTVASETETH